MKLKSLIIFNTFVSFLFTTCLYSQINLQWAKFYHSFATYGEEAKSLCYDNSNNIYVVGGRKILKYNSGGDLLFEEFYPNGGIASKVIFGTNCIFAGGGNGLIKLIAQGNIAIISNEGFVDIQKSKDNYLYGVANNSGSIILYKYNLEGSYVWSRSKERNGPYSYSSFGMFEGIGNKINIFGRYAAIIVGYLVTGPVFLTYDSIGNVLYDGSYPSGIVRGYKNEYLGNNLFAGYIDYSSWHSDILIYKLNSGNVILDTVTYNGTGNSRDEPGDIVTDDMGNIYLAGKSWGVAVDYDFVVLKYSSNLELVWEYRFNGSQNSYDKADHIALDQNGNIVASGTVNSNGIEIYTVKLSPDGQLLWSDKFNRYNSVNDSNYVNDLQIDNSGNILLCGRSRDSVMRWYDYVTVKYSDPTSIINSETVFEKDFSILQNYPNPFNPETKIKFNLAKRSKVKIDIINSNGKKIIELANSFFPNGEQIISWNAGDLPSGIYFISFQSDNYKEIKKAILLK